MKTINFFLQNNIITWNGMEPGMDSGVCPKQFVLTEIVHYQTNLLQISLILNYYAWITTLPSPYSVHLILPHLDPKMNFQKQR